MSLLWDDLLHDDNDYCNSTDGEEMTDDSLSDTEKLRQTSDSGTA